MPETLTDFLEQADKIGQDLVALKARAQEQAAELDRLNQLLRFITPHITRPVVLTEDQPFADGHRREVVVMCCGLHGFTALAETTEAETAVTALCEYHEALGRLIFRFEGRVERVEPDTLTVVFNDLLPGTDPAPRAVQLAIAARQPMQELIASWRRRGYELGFSVGIDLGYTNLGTIGYEGRVNSGAISTVVNLARCLCREAQDGQILVSKRVYTAAEEVIEASCPGELNLDGFVEPVCVFSVEQLRAPPEPASLDECRTGHAELGLREDQLTGREWQVAALIAKGLTNRQIANQLVLSERTAERHVENIRHKLGVTSRTRIAAWAAEHGLHAARRPGRFALPRRPRSGGDAPPMLAKLVVGDSS